MIKAKTPNKMVSLSLSLLNRENRSMFSTKSKEGFSGYWRIKASKKALIKNP